MKSIYKNNRASITTLTTGEVLEMARARFRLDPADREPPVSAPPQGRDPLAKHGTDKARFFRGVRHSRRTLSRIVVTNKQTL